jgi:hypothetical protein
MTHSQQKHKTTPSMQQQQDISKPVKQLASKYQRTERKIVVAFHPSLADPTPDMARKACATVNRVRLSTKDIQVPPFLHGRFSGNQNLILSTGPHTQNIGYQAYLGLISHSLQQMGANTIKINIKWTQFVAHGIPANANSEYVFSFQLQ